jgi:chromosome partitioning protein
VILIDCPPSLGVLTVNALVAASEVLIPIQCEYYALEGVSQLLKNVKLVTTNLNPDLKVGGVVLTMYDGRTKLSKDVSTQVRDHFGDICYRTVIPRSVRLSEAPSYGEPIEAYAPMTRGAIAYRHLAKEFRIRHGLDKGAIVP